VAVFLKNLADRWQEIDRIVPLVTDILFEDGRSSTPCPTGRALTKIAPR
jgi:hypothetical protein